MCGIVGYIGRRPAQPFLLNGLKKLEYRGYDSAGMAVMHDGKIIARKQRGRVSRLEALLAARPLAGSTGISHSRWATHGIPSHANAHPHLDCLGNIAVVHNGIIENYEDLKTALAAEGHRFLSDTDTEVIPHLIEKFYKGDFAAAVRAALGQLKGSFALGIISNYTPGVLFAARRGSPLVVGIGKEENYVASDIPALLEYTSDVIYIEDNELAVISKDSICITDFKGRRIKKTQTRVAWDIKQAQKGGYQHFMLKEIHEQPAVISNILQHRLRGSGVFFKELTLPERYIKSVKKICIVACGTAYHAGLVGKYILERLTGIPVEVDVSSEFRYRNPILGKNTLVVAISQSGETADTLAGIRQARKQSAKVLSIVNVVGATMTRESDSVIYTHAGPEIGVASTKAYTAQLCVLYLFGIYAGTISGALARQATAKMIDEIRRLPRCMGDILRDTRAIKNVCKKHKDKNCFLYLGRNLNYPNALEGALKLKEISYVHAEGYSAGEMKHGPIALIDKTMPVVCIVPKSATYDKMVSNIQEIKARKGIVISIATEADPHIGRYSDHTIYIPGTNELFSPMLTVLPLQLLAYYIALANGRDVDRPRNLAKSVTVE
ncbi:MAG: glutamine--fructose-6-phosphate transaminase (isomerizing) [Candidatus Omnitrophica bacterium]|nr:glutamine--fructose-6-phosphate transaminase (isomerizing) [Candidatus Omnitrophota bacterium]